MNLRSLSSNDGNGKESDNECKHLGNADYFVIVASSSHLLLLTGHAANIKWTGRRAVEVNRVINCFAFTVS